MRTRRSSGRERRSNVGERIPRVVTVVRRTAYESLLERHATRGQAQFFLATRGEGMDRVETAHRRVHEAIGHVLQAIPPKWRRAQVDRDSEAASARSAPATDARVEGRESSRAPADEGAR